VPPGVRFLFDRFEIDPQKRRLLRQGEPLPISDRQLDVLLLLVARAGQIVSKDDLLQAGWKDVAVGDNSLEQAISSMRRMLGSRLDGSGYIETVARRGYRLSAEVERRTTRESDATLDAILAPYRAFVEGRAALETLERATDIVLDKTGTLTEGKFSVARVHTLARRSESQCLALARALEASSRHPLAEAFAAGPEGPAAIGPRNVPGQGIEARVEGARLRIGTEAFCRELCAHPPPPFALSEAALTPVFLASEEAFLAVFLLEDQPRPEAAAAVRALKDAGLRVHLLSGDAAEVAACVGARLGIETCTGDATPPGKLAYIARLQSEGRVVAMVGDGLNDAPVLARADVSFAMGAGADAAQLHSDFVLTGNALGEVPATLSLARRTMRIVRQNFGWALAYNALALPLAAAGLVGPLGAAAGMAASSFLVVLNALRVSRTKEQSWKASSSSSLSPSRSFS